jgi:hypothetical protein
VQAGKDGEEAPVACAQWERRHHEISERRIGDD